MVGMGPVGIAHNLLEGICGHTSPEKFSILKQFQGPGSCGVTDRFLALVLFAQLKMIIVCT